MANLIEEVVKIRQILENGSGGESGGGSSLKSINITNGLGEYTTILHYLDENGKYVYPFESEPRIEAGETMTVYYPEPAEGSLWVIEFGSQIITQDEVTGVVIDSYDILIDSSADNDISVTIYPYIDVNDVQ